jgi:hypothetical protein
MHTWGIEVSWIIVAAVLYIRPLPQNTSLVRSVLVPLYSKTIPLQRRRGSRGFERCASIYKMHPTKIHIQVQNLIQGKTNMKMSHHMYIIYAR